jgi:hypothetical protein
MSLFTSLTGDVLTPVDYESAPPSDFERAPAPRAAGLFKGGRGNESASIKSDSGATPDLSKQFVIFHLNPKANEPAVLEASKVEPKIDGSREEPDVLVALDLLSLQLGSGEEIDAGTKATLRLNFGKDESSTDKKFETAFWSVAAGLNLYNTATNKKANNKDFGSDLQKAFGNRPIEIPGGLGRLSLEIETHSEPPWWKRTFNFLQSGTGAGLVSMLGFPAVTTAAIDALDQLLSRLTENDAKPLFKSLPMRLALSKYARDEYSAGNERIVIGSMSRGFCIMARGRDREVLNNADVVYNATYGKLLPQGLSDADLMSGRFQDPLEGLTYAVFRVGTKSTKLDPTFNFG